MFYLDSTAKQTMYNFLRSHRDQFQFCAGTFPKQENIIDILETPRIMYRTIIPNSQLRIVNVKTVLETINYPINNFSLKIRIRDEQCPWNNGDFDLSSENGTVKVVYGEESDGIADLESDIGHFSQLLAGFRTINNLLEFNFIKINIDKKELLQMLFPLTNNYFREFF
jgi:predicted acetyltransferase